MKAFIRLECGTSARPDEPSHRTCKADCTYPCSVVLIDEASENLPRTILRRRLRGWSDAWPRAIRGKVSA